MPRSKVFHYYGTEALAARLLALAELAPQLGIADEAAALFADIVALPHPSPAGTFTPPPLSSAPRGSR